MNSDIINLNETQFRRVAKALADPNRCEILEMVSQNGNEMSCGAVVEKMPLTQATVSHHLKELVESGLLNVRAERQFNMYSANRQTVEAYTHALQHRLLAQPIAAEETSDAVAS